jgi:hypothetical protein
VAFPEFPEESFAVTVITLIPLCRGIPDADQVAHEVVVVALPLPPLRFAQVTPVITASREVVPAISSGLVLVS